MISIAALKSVARSKISRQLLLGKKHAPTILVAAGTIGVVTSVVLACRATLKLEKVLNEGEQQIERYRETRDDKSISDQELDRLIALSRIRMVGRIARLYAPTGIVLVASVAALIGSHMILRGRYITAVTAYAGLDKAYSNYRGRVIEEFGEEKDREFRQGIRNEELTETMADGKTKKTTVKTLATGEGNPYSFFFGEHSTIWEKTPAANFLTVSSIQQLANLRLQTEGYLFLNDVLDMFGLPKTRVGAEVGWVLDGDGDNQIDFGIFKKGQNYAEKQTALAFVRGQEPTILIDPNCDGYVLDKFENAQRLVA